MPVVPVTRLPFALTETSVLGVIPARYQSTRLPGKPLLEIGGRPLIEHVYRRASAAALLDALLVATDDERIAGVVDAFGGVACMTSPGHRSGTDRIAEVAAAVPCALIVNVQGDEPLLDPVVIDTMVAALQSNPAIAIGTAARRVRDEKEVGDPNMVKVVCDGEGRALYFSRASIPHGRGGSVARSSRIHIGLYVYRRETLLRIAALAPGPLERAEALEQLRALEHGISIAVVATDYRSIEVNTPEDLERVRHLVTGSSGAPVMTRALD